MFERLAIMLSLALAACAGSGSGDPRYGGSVSVRSAELVPLEADLYVLADADQPIFYTNDAYWLYDDGGWYRSPRYTDEWVRVATPPMRLQELREPQAFVRYRARSQTARNVDRDDRRDDRRYDRELRDYPETVPEPPQPAEPVRPYPRPPQQQSPLADEPQVRDRDPSPALPAPRAAPMPPVTDTDPARGPQDKIAPEARRVPPVDDPRGERRTAPGQDVRADQVPPPGQLERPTSPDQTARPSPGSRAPDRGRGNVKAPADNRDPDDRAGRAATSAPAKARGKDQGTSAASDRAREQAERDTQDRTRDR